MNNGLDALRKMVDLTFKYDDNLINKMADLSNIVLKDLERLEKLEKVVNDFLEYLSKEPNRTILKHSIKQTFDKLLKEELMKNENIQ